jgi:hypothetical protein
VDSIATAWRETASPDFDHDRRQAPDGARIPHSRRHLVDKLRIIGLEGGTSGVTVEAQFNPKEISVDKSVPWQKQKTQGPGDLEFSAAERTESVTRFASRLRAYA